LIPLYALALLVTAGTQNISLAAPNLSGLNVDETAASFYSQHLAQQLAGRGVQVTTAKQIQTLLGFERQKQLMGCSEDSSSCLTELANALGVDGIITGDVGRFDRKYQLNVKVISSSDGRELSAYSARVDGEEALLDEIVKAGKKMAPEISERLNKPLAPPTEAARTADRELAEKNRGWAWLPTGVGAALAVGGTLALVQSQANLAGLAPSQPISTLEGQRLRNEGQLFQGLGYGLLGGAALALAGGAAIFLLNPDPPAVAPARVGWVPAPGGGLLVLEGVLP